ncbi:MAG: type II secretion system protein GspJ [Rhizobiaceae bacterium]|jgi:prepilin-type N-terminal cleavage/methylation domain-containing protein|nr:type II secretion system protein GspJ [Rhizobiaceae bacterium]
MTRRIHRKSRGFTLIEALAALALGALLFGLIAQFTGAWLGRWRDVVMVSSRQDAALVVLDRMADDIGAAMPFVAASETPTMRFDIEGAADRITFVRAAIGFNARSGLDRVTYRVGDSGGINALIRQRRNAAPGGGAGENLPLLRGDIRMALTYFDERGTAQASWDRDDRLPAAIRIDLSSQTPRPWARTMVVRLNATWPAACGSARYSAQCVAERQ